MQTRDQLIESHEQAKSESDCKKLSKVPKWLIGTWTVPGFTFGFNRFDVLDDRIDIFLKDTTGDTPVVYIEFLSEDSSIGILDEKATDDLYAVSYVTGSCRAKLQWHKDSDGKAIMHFTSHENFLLEFSIVKD